MSRTFSYLPGTSLGQAPASGTRRARLAAAARALCAAWKAWHANRRDVARLQSMDERMLKDIGLSRCEIGNAVRLGRYQG